MLTSLSDCLYLIQDGKPMEDSPRMKFIHEEDNYTLLIYEVLPEDAGSYACVAINSVGKATCTATLNVESKLLLIVIWKVKIVYVVEKYL